MDRLKAMSIFVRIVDSGSLTAASEACGQSTASVVRSLAALEQHLGVRLLNRNTRRIALTAEGADFLEWSRRMLAEFESVEQRLATRTPSGLLRLTAPVEFGQCHIAPLVNRFLLAMPGMRVELVLLDRVVDLLNEGLDLAVRIGPLPDSSLIATTLGYTRLITCASPAYLAAAPALRHPSDLMQHHCIGVPTSGEPWTFDHGGKAFGVSVSTRLVTNHVRAARQACVDGLGVTRLMHYQIADALADGRLLRLLPDFEPAALPIQWVYPHARLQSARVRHFLDWMDPLLRERIESTNRSS